MKNKTEMMSQRNQNQVPDWLFQAVQEDDFLLGKTPNNLPDIWEDEE